MTVEHGRWSGWLSSPRPRSILATRARPRHLPAIPRLAAASGVLTSANYLAPTSRTALDPTPAVVAPAPPRGDEVMPVLPSRALDGTLAFYGAAGFTLVARYEAEGYPIVRRGAVEVHFCRVDVDPSASYAGCYVRLADLAPLADWRAAFAAAPAPYGGPHGAPAEGIPRLRDDGDAPYGPRGFHVVDPSGILLRVGAPVGAAAAGRA